MPEANGYAPTATHADTCLCGPCQDARHTETTVSVGQDQGKAVLHHLPETWAPIADCLCDRCKASRAKYPDGPPSAMTGDSWLTGHHGKPLVYHPADCPCDACIRAAVNPMPDDLKEQNTTLGNLLGIRNEEYRLLTGQYQNLEAANADLERTIATLQAESDAALKLVNEGRRLVNELQALNERLTSESDATARRLETQDAKIADLLARNKILKTDLDRLTVESQIDRASNKALRRDVAGQNDVIAYLQRSVVLNINAAVDEIRGRT